MKYQVEINVDEKGRMSLKDALFVLKQEDPAFAPGPVTAALRNFDIPHRRSSKAKKARISVCLEDIRKWLKKNTNSK